MLERGVVLPVVAVGYIALTRSSSSAEAESLPTPTVPAITQVVRDNSDPQDTGCARLPGVVVLDTTEVDWDSEPAGVVQLKYSPSCGAAWPRFEPNEVTNLPVGTVVHTDIVRPDDNNARYEFDAKFVGEVVFGNLALSTSKCVYASVWFETKNGTKLPESRTHCFRGATYVR